MHYRRFGRTELNLPVFSTGGMRYQDGWKDKPLDEIDDAIKDNLSATIQRSFDVGIHHVETARGYGPSERQLGTVLPNYPRDSFLIQTKIGPTESPDEFTAFFHESLERLRLDRVDLLALHGVHDDTTYANAFGQDGKSGCLAAARRLQEQGLVGHVGFSTHGPVDELLRAIRAPGPDPLPDAPLDLRGNPPRGFDYINLHWYFIYQRNWPAIVEARRRDMGVFLISPTDKGGHLHTPTDKLIECCDPLHPIVFNDLWCLRRGEVHTLSLGASKPTDYDLHVEAADRLHHPETPSLVRRIESRLRDAMADATGHPDPEHLVFDLPDHRAAPGGLNVPLILWLRNLSLGWGMTPYAKARFNLMGTAGPWFPGSKVMESFDEVDKDALAAACDVGAWEGRGREAVDLVADAIDRLGDAEVKRLSQS
ncbi:MAG: aldo/keto reductase [Planctomycetota bacterium]